MKGEKSKGNYKRSIFVCKLVTMAKLLLRSKIRFPILHCSPNASNLTLTPTRELDFIIRIIMIINCK